MSEPKAKVLFVDDEESVRYFARRGLKRRGYDVVEAEDGEAALRAAEIQPFDVAVTDLRMPGIDGFEVLSRLHRIRSDLPVVVITAHGSVENAVEAMREGARDFLAKPFEIDELAWAIDRALGGAAGASGRPGEEFLGRSPQAVAVRSAVERLAQEDLPFLLVGESGTGKELVARAVHRVSRRARETFHVLNLVALDQEHAEGEVESVLRTVGEGTLLVTGVGEVDESMLGRVAERLRGGAARIVGAVSGGEDDVPALAATVFGERVGLPPLRTRREDVTALGEHFLRLAAEELGAQAKTFDEAARQALQDRAWPGNVRELRNLVQRAVVLHRDVATLGLQHLPELAQAEGSDAIEGYQSALLAFEKDYFARLFRDTRGNVSEAARRAGLSRGHMHRKVKQLGIDPDQFR